MQIRLGGVLHPIRANTLDVEDAVEARSRLRCVIEDDDSTLQLVKGMPAELVDDTAAVVFSGFIEQPKRRYLEASGATSWTVACVDLHYLADKRIVASTYEGVTAGAVVRDIITTVLAAEGITAGTIVDGPTIVAVVLNYPTVAAAMDELAEQAGVAWWIAPDAKLHFAPPGAMVAPWMPTYDDLLAEAEVDVDDAAPLYRNRQYVRGGLDITDPQTETRAGDDETRAFTMSFPLAKVPTVTVDAVAQTVGIRGVEDGKDWHWNKGDPVVSQERTAAALTPAQQLSVTYQGQYAVIAVAEAPEAIADRQTIEGSGSGLVEHVADIAGAPGRDALFEAAKSRLAKYAVIGRTATFVTDRAGLAPGQTITLDLPERGLDQVQMLIAAVRVYDREGLLRWRVSAVEGPVVGSLSTMFSALVRGQATAVDLVNVGGGDVLTRLVSFTETTGWAETLTVTSNVCTVPDGGAFPDTGLYPC